MVRWRVRSLPLLFLLIMAGCASVEKRVDLTYQRHVDATGGSGEIFVAQPTIKRNPEALPAGREVLGKAGDADIVIAQSPADWLLSAIKEELSAAGYEVKTVAVLPPDVPKGVKPSIVALSAHQSSSIVKVTTITEVKLEAELWKNGKLLKTLTASAQDHEEGADRSSEPIRQALEKALQGAMEELVPEIVKALQ